MKLSVYDDKYVIKSDRRQYFLYKVATKKKDKDVEEEVSEDDPNLVFHGSFETIPRAIEFIAKQEARLTNATTWEGYIKHITSVEKKIEALVNKLEKIVGEEVLLKRCYELDDKIRDNDEYEKKKTKTRKVTSKPFDIVVKPAPKKKNNKK